MFTPIKDGNVSNIHDSWRESLLPLVIRVFKGPKMKVKVLVSQLCPTLCNPMDCSTSLSITNSWSLLKLMSIELVMPCNHFISYV